MKAGFFFLYRLVEIYVSGTWNEKINEIDAFDAKILTVLDISERKLFPRMIANR